MRRLRNILAPLAAMLLSAATIGGGPDIAYDWRNVAVGGGGFAPGIIFSRAERGLAYLRTDMGGAYRWEDRVARWVPLGDSLAESSFMGIESIAPDPADPDTVYMAAGMYRRAPAAILRSHDRGTTWAVTPLPIRMGGNEDGRGLGERLAVDPQHRQSILFGSRHDGLWRSDDSGVHWARDPRFPYAGRGLPAGRGTNAGIAFVIFDSRAGQQRIFAGVADRGAQALYRSSDSGSHWQKVDGGPPDLLPVKADIGADGTLYIAYADGIGPNGVTRGAVWSLSPEDHWRDITPDRSPAAPPGGYMGISADATHPGTLLVSTVDRWRPIDTIWRTTDGGAHWADIGPISRRDTRATPFLNWGKREADFGHWIAGLAIDPFDPDRAAYTTGATVYVTHQAEARRTMMWAPWIRGIEQTAILTLVSPTGGAPLISGFGDLGGFVHDSLDRSPPTMFLNPRHTNTNTLDYAGAAPQVVVRSGNVHAGQPIAAGLGWSADGGHSWLPLRTPSWRAQASFEAQGRAPITVSADGRRFYVGAEQPVFTTDRGVHWTPVTGLPGGVRIVADKVDPQRAWAIAGGRLLASYDGGAHFVPVAAWGACADLNAAQPRNRESPSSLVASPFRTGDLFLLCDRGLYHSVDGGARFDRIDHGLALTLFGLGKGAAEAGPPAIFAVAEEDGERRLWRSIDGGAQWRRIDDAAHRWGGRFRVITGDPRRFGRVYVGTDGRGILYGDPAADGHQGVSRSAQIGSRSPVIATAPLSAKAR